VVHGYKYEYLPFGSQAISFLLWNTEILVKWCSDVKSNWHLGFCHSRCYYYTLMYSVIIDKSVQDDLLTYCQVLHGGTCKFILAQ